MIHAAISSEFVNNCISPHSKVIRSVSDFIEYSTDNRLYQIGCIDLSGYVPKDGNVEVIFENLHKCTTLYSLKLNSSVLSSRFLADISSASKSLQVVTIEYCDINKLVISPAQFKLAQQGRLDFKGFDNERVPLLKLANCVRNYASLHNLAPQATRRLAELYLEYNNNKSEQIRLEQMPDDANGQNSVDASFYARSADYAKRQILGYPSSVARSQKWQNFKQRLANYWIQRCTTDKQKV